MRDALALVAVMFGYALTATTTGTFFAGLSLLVVIVALRLGLSYSRRR